MKKPGKIVPAALLALTLSMLAACGCGETGQSESDMVENTTDTQSPTTEAEDTVLPPVEDNSVISGNETNGGNSTVSDSEIGTQDGGILDDAGNAVGDMLDDAGNVVNDAVDSMTNDSTDHNTDNTTQNQTGTGTNR